MIVISNHKCDPERLAALGRGEPLPTKGDGQYLCCKCFETLDTNRPDRADLDIIRCNEAISRLDDLTDYIATMREELFHYGEGYDDEVDQMMGSPMVVLHNIDCLLSGLAPEEMKRLKVLFAESFSVVES